MSWQGSPHPGLQTGWEWAELEPSPAGLVLLSSPAQWGGSHRGWPGSLGGAWLRSHMGPAQSGAEPAWEGALLPWGLTSLLQGSQDSCGGVGAALPTGQWSQMPSFSSGHGRQDPGEHSWECEKAQPRINGLQRAQGPVRWGEGAAVQMCGKHLGRRGPPDTPLKPPRCWGLARQAAPGPAGPPAGRTWNTAGLLCGSRWNQGGVTPFSGTQFPQRHHEGLRGPSST